MKLRLCCILLASLLFTWPVHGQTPFEENIVRLSNPSEVGSIIDEVTSISDEISDLMAGADETASGQANTPDNNEITVVRGNTLSGLARRLLGNARRWRDLVEWNYDRYPSLLKNPDLILVGWKLRTSPPGTSSTPAASPSTNSNTASAAVEAGGNVNNSDRTSAPVVRRSDGPLITPESRVLHIGDSHTCGVYGKAMDELMRETGATVRTYGVSGSSPSWWLNETTGKSGYYARDEHGNVDQPADWRTPRKTPNLNRLISEYRPDVIMFSLGANLVHASPEVIRRQVEAVCRIAREAGARIAWVGPPRGRPGLRDPAARERLYENLKKTAEQYGTFIDSRDYTRYPDTGGDGAHYSGAEGSRVAREWAGQVFNNVQSQPSSR